MVINTWHNFEKDKNSTKQPTNGTSYNMTLKEDTSLINPTFIFNYNGVPTFNYCQYNLIYYFVDDIIQRNKNIYEIKCSIDVLASYRADILASTQFVTRSSSDYNIYLEDSEMHPSYNMSKSVNITNIDSFDVTTGSYIVRVMGNSENGSFSYGIPAYILNEDQIRTLVKKCFDQQVFNDPVLDLQDAGDLLKCLFFNPSEYIISINWLPLNISGGVSQQVYCGWYGTGISAPALNSSGHASFYTLQTPSRYFNDFRDFSTDYTRFELSVPCVGVVPLNNNDVYDGITINVYVEYLTGNVLFILYNTQTNAFIAKYSMNINASIQIGGVTHGQVGDNVVDAVKNIVTGISSPSYATIGEIGSKQAIYLDHAFRLTRRLYGSSGYGTSRVGRPLNEVRTLSTLSGYCQCDNAKLDTSAFGGVKEEIINHMNTGFIIE